MYQGCGKIKINGEYMKIYSPYIIVILKIPNLVSVTYLLLAESFARFLQ